jgi:DNA-binding transcriptional LysR family regulator
MNNGLNWENLKYFLALANTSRLQKAAKELGSNHSTVYRRIKSFEEEIGLKLFESSPGGYQLTPAGEKLLAVSSELAEKMNDVDLAIRGIDQEPHGNIRLTTTASIAATILAPIINKFRKKWPGITIELIVGNQHLNLSKREADIAIRPSSKVPEHLVGMKLGYLNFSVFGTSKYAKKINSRNFNKLASETDFLGLEDSLSHLKSKQWQDQLPIDQNKVYRTNNLALMGQLCSAGVGLAVIPDYFEIVHKNLKCIYRPKQDIGNDIWILSHKDLLKNSKVKLALNFFHDEIKESLRDYL